MKHLSTTFPYLTRCKLPATLATTLAAVILTGFLLVSCNGNKLPTMPPVRDTLPSTTPVEEATQTPLPTDTPQPTSTELPPTILFVSPTGSLSSEIAEAKTALQNLAEQEGLLWHELPSLTTSDLTPNVRLVVASLPDPGLQQLAVNAPQIQFLGLGIPGLEPGENISLLGFESYLRGRQGFVAGLVAAMTSSDWRTAIITTNSPEGAAAKAGFINGNIFYCGLCRPVYPPYYDGEGSLLDFPLAYELPLGASAEVQQAAVSYLVEREVEVVYVFPEAAGEVLWEAFAETDIQLIGGTSIPEPVAEQWSLTLKPDVTGAIGELWPKLIDGEGNVVTSLSLTFENINRSNFSQGKQMLVEQLLAEIEAGAIATGGEIKP